MAVKTKDINVSLEQLVLDPNNYRLTDQKEEKSISDSDAEELEDETLKRLENQRLGELKDSMINNGFLEMERIVVRVLDTIKNRSENDLSNKKYVVVEGNRRTAALKVLKSESEKVKLNEELEAKFSSLNVILIEGDEDQIRKYSATLMGIRHVSGPKKWDGFQSAMLINDLFKAGHSFTEIGSIIGITNREVGRRFRGYRAFRQMKSDPDFKNKVEPRHYGLLLEFLASSKNGKDWLNWSDTAYKFQELNNLKRVYNAITLDEKDNLEIRNPADARKFVSLLETDFVSDIEEGKSIHDMPDPVDLQSGKLKRINSFKLFIEKSVFLPEEEERLQELLELLKRKLSE